MYSFVIVLIIVISFLLVMVILAQNAKGGGLTSQFGGSAASNIIGVKKTGDLLEKLTWSFIIAIMALTLSTNFLDSSSGVPANSVLEKAGQQGPAQQLPQLPTPDQGTPTDSAN
jgi:preprotein translocase subunit SecG